MSKNILFGLIFGLVLVLALNITVWADYDGDEYVEFGSIQNLSVIDADKIPYGESPLNKLERGVINGATFWMELPAEVARVSKEQDPAMGATVGVVHGTITSAVRAGTALFDAFTFFIPSYDKPVMKPEYAYNRVDQKMRELFW